MTVGQITYYTYDLMTGTLLAELPFTGVSWSTVLNGAGTFSGNLDLASPAMAGLNALDGTRPSRTLLVVDVDGAIEWAGIIWARPSYDSDTRTLGVSADEAWAYFGRRMQAADYTKPPGAGTPGHAFWTANPARGERIAAAVVADALARGGSAFGGMTINVTESIPNTNTQTMQYPIAQMQQLDSIVSTLAEGGYLTGFDFGIDWQWSGLPGSTPVPTLNLNYPRRGRIAGTTGLVLDASTGTKYTWAEDGRQQVIILYGTAGGSGALSTTQADPTPIAEGYPLLEATKSYSQIINIGALRSAAKGDLAALEWPVIAPTFVLPMFGTMLALGDFLIGDDCRIVIDPDERFPNGLDTYLRIVGLGATPADAGESTMTLTMALPPGLAPVPPPPM